MFQTFNNEAALLLKLLRGCHLSNVQGMGWRSGGFARPLLDVRKAEECMLKGFDKE